MSTFQELQFVKGEYYWITDPHHTYLAVQLLSDNPEADGGYKCSLYTDQMLAKKYGSPSKQSGHSSTATRLIDESLITSMIPAPADITLSTIHEDLVEAVRCYFMINFFLIHSFCRLTSLNLRYCGI